MSGRFPKRRFAPYALIVVLALVCVIVVGGPAGAAKKPPAGGSSSAPTWQLVDYQQKVCISPTVKSSIYGIWINGTWKHSISVGVDNLPSGGSFTTSYAPIKAGSSTGVYSLAYVNPAFKNAPANGTYTASLWASDGSTRESVPVTLVVQDSCRHY